MKSLVIVVSLLVPTVAFASHESVVGVVQPLSADGPGFILAQVPFVRYGSRWDTPGLELAMTVVANSVMTDSGAQNRNAAAQVGIRFELAEGAFDPEHQQRFHGLYGDTLRVRVDLSSTIASGTDPQAIAHNSWLPELIPLTLKCGLMNARSRWPRVQQVEYQIEGNPEYAQFDGVYSLENVSVPPMPFQDLEPLKPPGR